MFFFIKKTFLSNSPFAIKSLDEINENVSNFIAFDTTGQKKEVYYQHTRVIIVLGDLVVEKNTICNFEFFYQAVKHNTIHQFGGFFYLIYIDNHKNIVKLWSSLFSILPVYYCKENNSVTISSRMELILSFSKNKNHAVDKQYLLERVLFNFGLFNRTYLETIKLVSTNHYLEICDDCFYEKPCLDLADLFSDNYKKGKTVLNDLSEKFIASTQKYLPDKQFAVSFTGGFDGRSLVAISRSHQKDFFAYSFGTPDSEDVLIPLSQAENLSLEFKPVYLSDAYVQNESYDCGIKLIIKTEGAASFARAHYVYAARMLSETTDHIVTGNFGSELFRAMHNPGVVVAQELISFFGAGSKKEWQSTLIHSPKLQFLRKNCFKNELASVMEELEAYKQRFNGMETNLFFYTYVLGEIFRKYFGPETVMQQFFITTRAPFLDFGFIKELFQSYYCGVYSDFFTDNPFKRYKGQLLYPYIIKKAYPLLLGMKTGKGYTPGALLSSSGKLGLIANLIRKKVKGSGGKATDPFAVKRAFMYNRSKWSDDFFNNEIYNEDYIRECVRRDAFQFDMLSNMISSNYYLFQTSDLTR